MIPDTFHIRSGRLTEFVGDDEYELHLKIGELRLLQSSLNSGPSAILLRLQTGEWFVDDIVEPIRLGLIGGGMDHKSAKRIVTEYVTDGYLIQYQPVALKALLAALIGNEDDMPDMGEPMAPAMTETPDDLFDGEPTSSSLEPLDTHPDKSMK